MLSEQVISRLKEKIPLLKEHSRDHTMFGITQVDIELNDGTIKQIVLLFERLSVLEPEQLIPKNKIYADVYIHITDEVLAAIATKEISLDEALEEKMFKVFGDREIWNRQLEALRRILPQEEFSIQKPIDEIDENNDEDIIDDWNWIEIGSLPYSDLSGIPEEFKDIVAHFEALRYKYNTKIN